MMTPPSGRTRPEPVHVPPRVGPTSAQVQVAGQSLSALQVVAFAWQRFVVDGGHLQSGGGGGGGAPVGGGVGLPLLPEPALPEEEPDPVEPAQAQPVRAGTQLKPAPQLSSVVHGSV